MIRHHFDAPEVAARIAAIDSNWSEKAAERTKKLLKGGRYEEASSIWSTVKPVFMELQHNKCVFCERQLEDALYGPVEWDLEHFRPKSNVARWPDPTRHAHLAYGEDLGDRAASGYFWLAYELRNYAASCKVCNTIFKLNFFPVRAPRAAAAAKFEDLGAECPLLCYPFDQNDDPEHLVTYRATTAVPAHQAGEKALRGRVIIDFFGLNHRDQLHRERARMIGAAGSVLNDRDNGVATPKAQAMIARLVGPQVPHAACVRAFLRLWDQDRPTALRAYDLCREFGFAEAGVAPPTLDE